MHERAKSIIRGEEEPTVPTAPRTVLSGMAVMAHEREVSYHTGRLVQEETYCNIKGRTNTTVLTP